jgi:hypothetical protein
MQPDLDIDVAQRRLRRASIAGVIAAVLTLVDLGAAPFGLALPGIAPPPFPYTVILLALVLGVVRRVRYAALLLLFYYVVSYVVWWQKGALSLPGILLALPFAFVFTQAAHASQLRFGPPPRLGRWQRVLALTAAVASVSFLGGAGYVGIVGPASYAVPGDELAARFVRRIRALGLLEEDESVRYFYSSAVLDIEDGCYFFTDRKVVVYNKNSPTPALVVPFSDISDVEAQFAGSLHAVTTITVTLHDRSQIWFPVSVERHGDRRFYASLLEAWQGSLRHRGLVPLRRTLRTTI